MKNHKGMAEFIPLNLAVLAVSDSRGLALDKLPVCIGGQS